MITALVSSLQGIPGADAGPQVDHAGTVDKGAESSTARAQDRPPAPDRPGDPGPPGQHVGNRFEARNDETDEDLSHSARSSRPRVATTPSATTQR